MTRPTWVWPIIIIISALAVGGVTFGDVTSPMRPLLALWFLVACPGMALVRLLQLGETFTELTLAIAVSLALDTIVAGTMLYIGAWSPRWSLLVLIGISLFGAVLQLVTGQTSTVETE